MPHMVKFANNLGRKSTEMEVFVFREDNQREDGAYRDTKRVLKLKNVLVICVCCVAHALSLNANAREK